jgi:arsenical pump membrane protein
MRMAPTPANLAIWAIAGLAIAGVIVQPLKLPEAVWAVAGAALVVVTGLLPWHAGLEAVGKGLDVYLFLAGMMLLSETARREGLFDWVASHAVNRANGSPRRLFLLVYVVGLLVTTFLSNDATAVVLTPAVYAATRKAGVEALPFLFVCAFIANAASFVLPISNPANLVVYGRQLPALIPWLKLFLLPSLLSIAATFLVLWLISRKELQGRLGDEAEASPLSQEGARAAWGIVATGGVLIGASAMGLDLGLPTCAAAVVAVVIATRANAKALAEVVRDASWSVLPLVAGLFVVVEALDGTGALREIRTALDGCARLSPLAGSLAASFGLAALSNVMNNLPSGLLAGTALQTLQIPNHIRHAVLLGTDLGPNLSVTGSLATVLWLIALRREGEHVSAWTFLKAGALVMPPALILATVTLVHTTK